MSTEATEIFDLFMLQQRDYRLTSLYSNSGSSVLNTYLEGFLLFAITKFVPLCTQDLAYDTTTQSFSSTLTMEHKLILAQIMVLYWLEQEVHDISQMRMTIQDKDFKHYSEAQNLTAKKDLLNIKKEEISQLLSEYGYRNSISWSDWALQIFGG
jgi:hypothetical protein